MLNVVERFHTLLKLRYFCHLHDAGKFLFAHFSVVSETPKPLISDLVEADGISPVAKAVLEFKFFAVVTLWTVKVRPGMVTVLVLLKGPVF